MEPTLRLAHQGWVWALGYVGLAGSDLRLRAPARCHAEAEESRRTDRLAADVDDSIALAAARVRAGLAAPGRHHICDDRYRADPAHLGDSARAVFVDVCHRVRPAPSVALRRRHARLRRRPF